MFKFDNQKIKVVSEKYKRIYVQLPLGLRDRWFELQEKFGNSEIFFDAESCWGGCDINYDRPCQLNADVLVHLGHSPFPIRRKIDTFFINVYEDCDIRDIPEIKETKVGLVAITQYKHLLKKVEKILKKKGCQIFPQGSDPKEKLILGCNYQPATRIVDLIDCFLLIADGLFHGQGLAIITKKKTYIYDPIKRTLVTIPKNFVDTVRKQRMEAISRARQAKTFGIIICTKLGQYRLDVAMKIKNLIKKRGLHGFFIVIDEITPTKLNSYPADVYVNTACPRIPIDEFHNYGNKILNVYEFKSAFSVEKFDLQKIFCQSYS
jgi:2-(3-amino-3-carboxypropyl)histidine synthase